MMKQSSSVFYTMQLDNSQNNLRQSKHVSSNWNTLTRCAELTDLNIVKKTEQHSVNQINSLFVKLVIVKNENTPLVRRT